MEQATGQHQSEAPLWSVMIPTFNSAKYLRQTLESVLAQAADMSLQFCVVDNGSMDETEAIVQEAGAGRTHFMRNDRNWGVMGNFNRCVALAKGRLVHILNSDDLVLPGFYKAYEESFRTHEDVYIITSNSELIDDGGRHLGFTTPLPHLSKPANAVDDFMRINPVRTPAVVVRREAYERLGAFNTTLPQCGDWDMWVRVIHAFKGLHLNQVLTQYREHSDNASSKVYQSGENILDTERLFRLFEERGYPIMKKDAYGWLAGAAFEQYLNLKKRGNASAPGLQAIFERLNGVYKAEASGPERLKAALKRKFLLLKCSLGK